MRTDVPDRKLGSVDDFTPIYPIYNSLVLGRELRSWGYLNSLQNRELRSYPQVSKYILVFLARNKEAGAEWMFFIANFVQEVTGRVMVTENMTFLEIFK